MDDDVKKRIERLKKEIEDYLKFSQFIELDEVTKMKRIDIYLDDLSMLLKQDKNMMPWT